MKLNELKNVEGARTKGYRKGRGLGSGNGKNCGTGNKGQKSRSGGLKAPGFEGGQTPLYRRLPKFGFTNGSRKEYAIVNVSALNKFAEGTEVTPVLLVESGLVKAEKDGVKILGCHHRSRIFLQLFLRLQNIKATDKVCRLFPIILRSYRKDMMCRSPCLSR